MSSDDPKKPTPEDILAKVRSGIKATVQATNNALASVQETTKGIRKPVESTFNIVSEKSVMVGEQLTYTFNRRHEFAPQLIGGSAVVGAAIMGLRRGRIAAVVGGVATGGMAYATVYDQINLDHVPDWIFGGKS
jgi:hypothetical protein